MSKTLVGVTMGNNTIKMVQTTNGVVSKIAVEKTPENLVRAGRILSVEGMSTFLRDMAKKNQINCKNASIALPSAVCFSRRAMMPYMNVDQLLLNLPYEFRDYIHSDSESYIYDYALVEETKDENGKIESYDMLVAAAKKEVVEEYTLALEKAKFRLKMIVPVPSVYRNIIRDYQKRNENAPKEYCFVDLGHSAMRIHMYKGEAYETTRRVEFGGATLDAIIADKMDVDIHIASTYKETNYENVQEAEECAELYTRMTVELTRALNFYNYNNPDNELRDVYFCGGLTKVKPLMNMLSSAIDLNVHMASELLNYSGQDENIEIVPMTIGATLQ